jgi:hypothetical protein
VTRPSQDAELGAADPRALVCTVCRARITDEAHRIERAGAHAHTFANPHGFVHHVRCFAAASGLAEVGAAESAFSWFPGYTWQIADCAACRVHIGWVFRCAGDVFYGLVAERLREG